jgi:DNA-directed RNA polymerase alpha subunit
MNREVPNIAFKKLECIRLNKTICKHLNEYGCEYIGDLMCSSLSEIAGVHGIGIKRFVKIQNKMKMVGVALETPIDNWKNLRPNK